MFSLQESFTLPQWVVDDTDDFINVLQTNLSGEIQSNMPCIERKLPGIQLSPYNNKEKTDIDHSNSEIDKILLSLTQQDQQIHENQDRQINENQDQQTHESQDHQIIENHYQQKNESQDHQKDEKSDAQLSEPERIDRMNEEEVIDYLVDLMKQQPSDPKTKPYQTNDKEMNKIDHSDLYLPQGSNFDHKLVPNTVQFKDVKQIHDTNLIQIDVHENGNLQNTAEYGDFRQLPDATVKVYNMSLNSEYQNPTSNYNIKGDKSVSLHHHSQSHQTKQINQNNQNMKETIIQSPHQSEILDKKPNQQKNNLLHFNLHTKTLIPNDFIHQKSTEELNLENNVKNGHKKIANQTSNRLEHSINQKVNCEEPIKIKINNLQHNLNNKTIYIQNATSSKNHKYILNKNTNQVQAAPAEKHVRTIDAKKILEIVNAQNKAFRNNKEAAIVKRSTINQNNTLQNQITIPIFNKVKEPSTNTCTKKRKKYEEEPQGDEEEGKKIFQAKKAKNYREKKKEESKMKDIQINKLQEALQKSEKEKNAYMNENMQLKEEIKKKDLLLHLYEAN